MRCWTASRLDDRSAALLDLRLMVNGGIIKVSAMTSGWFKPAENKVAPSDLKIDEGHIIKSGDLLLSRANTEALVGATVLVGEVGGNLLLSDKSLRLVPSNAVDPRYLVALLGSPDMRKLISSRATGTKDSMRNISQSLIRALEVPLPPLAEQRRILEKVESSLSRVEAGASSLRQAQLRIVGMERRVIRDALNGGDCAEGSSEPPAPPDGVPVRDGDLPSLPAHWRWARLHEIADVVGGITKDAAKQSDPAVPMVPYLRVANVQRGHLDLDHVTEIRVAEAKVAKLALQRGDVLLNEGGDRDKLGRGWIWEGQIERCIHQNHVFRARIRDGALHPTLLAWHANGFGHWFEANGKQSVNLASISLRTIKQLPVPVPPPDEQVGIVRTIEDRVAETARLRAALRAAQATALRRSILADAFAGRLVPQDPTDEPASVLLDRIRAERAAEPSRTRRPRAPRPS